jgi:hypothetical protein
VEDDVVHADVHLVQKSIVDEVTSFWLFLKQATLREEIFQGGAR